VSNDPLDDPSIWGKIDQLEQENFALKRQNGIHASACFPLPQPSSSLRMKEVAYNVEQNCPPVVNNSFHCSHVEISNMHPSSLRGNDSRAANCRTRTVNFTEPPVTQMYCSPPTPGVINYREPARHMGMQQMIQYSDPGCDMANSFRGGASPRVGTNSCPRSFSHNSCGSQPNHGSYSPGYFPNSQSAATSSVRRDQSVLYPSSSGHSSNHQFGGYVKDHQNDSAPSSSSCYHNHQSQPNFSNRQPGFNGSHSSGSGSRFSGPGSNASASYATANFDNLIPNNDNAWVNKPELLVRESTDKEVLVFEWMKKFLPGELGRRYFLSLFFLSLSPFSSGFTFLMNVQPKGGIY